MRRGFLYDDLINLVAGKQLGRGCYRTVFQYRPDVALVIKVAEEDPEQNVIEHAVWREIENAPTLSRWFAPVVAISPCGFYLLQKRVESGRAADYPESIPAWFTDIKRENFGWLGGQFVCCDYGGLMVTEQLNKRMKKVLWS